MKRYYVNITNDQGVLLDQVEIAIARTDMELDDYNNVFTFGYTYEEVKKFEGRRFTSQEIIEQAIKKDILKGEENESKGRKN